MAAIDSPSVPPSDPSQGATPVRGEPYLITHLDEENLFDKPIDPAGPVTEEALRAAMATMGEKDKRALLKQVMRERAASLPYYTLSAPEKSDEVKDQRADRRANRKALHKRRGSKSGRP